MHDMNGYACMCAGMSLCASVCLHAWMEGQTQLDGSAHFKKRRVLSSLITKQRAFGTAGKFTWQIPFRKAFGFEAWNSRCHWLLS